MHKNNTPSTNWFKYHFLEKKLNTVLGYFIFGLLAVGCAYCSAFIDFKAGFIFFGVFVAIFICALFLLNPYFVFIFCNNFFVASITSFKAYTKCLDIPFGSGTDILVYLLFFSVLIKFNFRSSR